MCIAAAALYSILLSNLALNVAKMPGLLLLSKWIECISNSAKRLNELTFITITFYIFGLWRVKASKVHDVRSGGATAGEEASGLPACCYKRAKVSRTDPFFCGYISFPVLELFCIVSSWQWWCGNWLAQVSDIWPIVYRNVFFQASDNILLNCVQFEKQPCI